MSSVELEACVNNSFFKSALLKTPRCIFYFLQRKGLLINSLFTIRFMTKEIINTSNAPAPIGPYNQAVVAGNMLFISGQICIDPATGNLKNRDIQDETH